MKPNEPLLVITAANDLAHTVIDSLVNGTSSGGVRIAGDITLAETKALAREMTLKFSLFDLPRGGAKSGIRIPDSAPLEEKRRILEDFGRCIAPLMLRGIYYPGTDMNCNQEDLKAISRGAGIVMGSVTDTAYFTALSVADSILAWEEFAGLGPGVLNIAIEGFGHVASHLAKRLPKARFRITTISTRRGAVRNQDGFELDDLISGRKASGEDLIRSLPGAKQIGMQEVLTADVDILVPSARTWTLNENNAAEVKARVIVPVANCPYTGEAVEILHQRGVVCLPGFLTNAGGVYASSLFAAGLRLEEIEKISATYFIPVVKSLLRKSKERGLPEMELAERVADKRFKNRPVPSNAGFGAKVGAILNSRAPLLRDLSRSARARQIVESLRKLDFEIARYESEDI